MTPAAESVEQEALRVRFSASDLAVDHTMALLANALRFLLEVTPINADAVRDDFLSAPDSEPRFAYRALDVAPDVLAAQLRAVPVDAVEDPTLGTLLRAKHRELELRVEMLRARDTRDFLPLSIESYGGVRAELRALAHYLLDALPSGRLDAQSVGAEAVLEAAQREIAHYRAIDPDVQLHAQVRDDVSGVLVDGDTLMIAEGTTVATTRVEALIQHEVGTHLVTQANGASQPIKTLGVGLAGYDETQEGLAVLAEIATGGLTRSRLRQLAARVVAVDALVRGATFAEAHHELTEAGLPAKNAFTTVMRCYRSGGFTKDAVYLRGLVDLLDHLRDGGTLAPLFLGKLALRDLPLVEDLASRGLLAPARILPRWLEDPAAADRLAAATATDDLTELVVH